MSAFTSDLVYRDNRGESWTLVESLDYTSDLVGELSAPKGMTTDLASIPGLVQGLIHKTGPWDRPAVIHDLLYSTLRFERDVCDKVLLEAMVVEGVGWWKRQAIYRAVRLGGWVAYNDHKRKWQAMVN